MRRQSRICALQILYQMDLGGLLDRPPRDADTTEAMARYWASFDDPTPADRRFTERLVRGVATELECVDAAIARVSRHWRVSRMDKVDKSLIRLAAYEILCCPDIPRAVSINEAIEIAKRFCGQDATAFVNGILDQLAPEATGSEAPSQSSTHPTHPQAEGSGSGVDET